jgi:hypothetical protein
LVPHKSFILGDGPLWSLIRRLYWVTDKYGLHKTFILGDGRAWSHLRRLLSKISLKRHEFKSGDECLTNKNIAVCSDTD